MEEKIELERWIECLQRAVYYSEDNDLKDDTYHHIKLSLAKAKGRLIYLENLEKEEEQ